MPITSAACSLALSLTRCSPSFHLQLGTGLGIYLARNHCHMHMALTFTALSAGYIVSSFTEVCGGKRDLCCSALSCSISRRVPNVAGHLFRHVAGDVGSHWMVRFRVSKPSLSSPSIGLSSSPFLLSLPPHSLSLPSRPLSSLRSFFLSIGVCR